MVTNAPPSPADSPSDPKDGRLHFNRDRSARRAISARDNRKTRLINRLRLLLPLSALLLLVALVAWPLIDPNKLKSIAMKNIPDLVIEHLHFTGLDSKNQPYSMTAARATRPAGLESIYDLDRPEGEMTTQSGAWVSGRAQYGRYDQETKRLWLGGDVQMFHDQGYEFTTDEAQIDMDDNDAWGAKPVLIQGDFGTIRGNGFRALDNGKTFIVLGPAKAILNLQKTGPSDTPEKTK